MTITLALKPEVEARVSAQASDKGLPVETYLELVIEAAVRPNDTRDRVLALLDQWRAEDATDDPTEIRARQTDWEDLKIQLDANRTSYRPLFP